MGVNRVKEGSHVRRAIFFTAGREVDAKESLSSMLGRIRARGPDQSRTGGESCPWNRGLYDAGRRSCRPGSRQQQVGNGIRHALPAILGREARKIEPRRFGDEGVIARVSRWVGGTASIPAEE